MNNALIDDLNWRYATKKYDSEKKISAKDFEIICESLRLAPSSYGLQPLKYFVIDDKSTREKLLPLAYNQPQITDASHLIVLCSFSKITPIIIKNYLELMSEVRNEPLSNYEKFGENMQKTFTNLSETATSEWTIRQAYIALGQVMHTCANLRIDATPMEGFDKAAFDKALNLTSNNLQSVLLLALGYRSPEDKLSSLPKVRKPLSEIIEIVK
jgi:nitroreductase